MFSYLINSFTCYAINIFNSIDYLFNDAVRQAVAWKATHRSSKHTLTKKIRNKPTNTNNSSRRKTTPDSIV